MLVFMLAIMSASVYWLQLYIFQKPADTFFYLFQDLAFVPVQVIVVSLALNKVLNIVEKRRNLKKVNVIISAFFAELGISIIFALAKLNANHDEFSEVIEVSKLNVKNVSAMKKKAKEFNFIINVASDNLESLQAVLIDKKSFMIGLLENSSLLEHDSFTDMLWSVFHVADELQSRDSLKNLTEADIAHLKLDVLRAYRSIILEWINYMKYLNAEYPYLFKLAIKKNPFANVGGGDK